MSWVFEPSAADISCVFMTVGACLALCSRPSFQDEVVWYLHESQNLEGCYIAHVDGQKYREVMHVSLWIYEHVTHPKIPHDIFASHKVLSRLDVIMCAGL